MSLSKYKNVPLSGDDDFDDEDFDAEITNQILKASAIISSLIAERASRGGQKSGSKNIPRQRVPVTEIFQNLGPANFRKAYRMKESTFWKLFYIIKEYLPEKEKRKRGSTPNGDIEESAQLSMALRWFAGGEAMDIMQTHGVAYGQVYICVWNIVDAINLCPRLKIEFPTDHAKQAAIAKRFEKKSWAKISNNCGDIDCMLVNTHKPNKATLRRADIGSSK